VRGRPLAALVAALACGGGALPPAPLAAQAGHRAPPERAAQAGVLLQIRPRPGDTLHMRLDQHVEVTARGQVGAADSTIAVTTTLLLLSRAIVERSDARGTVVRTVTDSVAVASTDGHAAQLSDAARRALVGREVRMLVAPDGAAQLLDAAAAGEEVSTLLSLMPAALPRHPVRPGDTWTGVMRMPVAGPEPPPATRAAESVVRASFRLDSLGAGDLAYISMRGTVSGTAAPDSAARAAAGPVAIAGTLLGMMVVDRRRGWLTDTRSTVSVKSAFAPSDPAKGKATRFVIKVTQRLRALP
jgi:hypothetical protein